MKGMTGKDLFFIDLAKVIAVTTEEHVSGGLRVVIRMAECGDPIYIVASAAEVSSFKAALTACPR